MSEGHEPVARYFIEGIDYQADELLYARIRVEGNEAPPQRVHEDGNVMTELVKALCDYRFTDGVPNGHGTPVLRPTKMGYRFDFVGVLVVRDFVLFVFPKFTRPDRDSRFVTPCPAAREAMARVLAVCDAHKRRIGSGAPDTSAQLDPDQSASSTGELYRALLLDYLRDGPYHSRTSMSVRNGHGTIDWPRTIERTDPLFTRDKRPVYADYITHERTVDHDALVRRLQLAYVAHAARWFDDIHLLTEVLQLPSDLRDVSHEDSDRLGSPERLRITLRQIRSREFSTRNAQLIDMLLALIDDTHAGVQRTLTATHLGIAPFDHVWEPLTSNRHRDPLGV